MNPSSNSSNAEAFAAQTASDPARAAELFAESVKIMARLRAPDGCPWDREQSFDSIRKYTLEEAYEVFDAIERRDLPHLAEELGDLLLQVLFYAEMAANDGHFTIADVLEHLNNKLIRRHPHVFGEEASRAAGNRAVVDVRWRVHRLRYCAIGMRSRPPKHWHCMQRTRLRRHCMGQTRLRRKCLSLRGWTRCSGRCRRWPRRQFADVVAQAAVHELAHGRHFRCLQPFHPEKTINGIGGPQDLKLAGRIGPLIALAAEKSTVTAHRGLRDTPGRTGALCSWGLAYRYRSSATSLLILAEYSRVTNSALAVDDSGATGDQRPVLVGVNSAGEQLSIQGGQVSDDGAVLGYSSSSSNNTVLVAGMVRSGATHWIWKSASTAVRPYAAEEHEHGHGGGLQGRRES